MFVSTTADPAAQLVRSEALLRHAFKSLPHVDHAVLLRPPGSVPLPATISSLFTSVPLANMDEGTESSLSAGTEIYLLPREPLLPTLHMRPARVEDHDDLVPVFEAQSEVVRSSFGK
jgi:hypothetical protein